MQGQSITYFRSADGYEVDFHAVARDGVVQLIQVCESLHDPDTRARELRALTAALRECGLPRGSIVTLEASEQIDQDGFCIDVLPAWRWLVAR